MVVNDTDEIYFEVRLLIRDATLALSGILGKLGTEPINGYSVGDQIQHGGRPTEHYHKTSVWQYVERITGQRELRGLPTTISKILLDRFDDLKALKIGGANIELIFDLSGRFNLAESFSPDFLRNLVECGVSLGIEVYPDI